MNGLELYARIEAEYPEEKPVVFNYANAREELLSLAFRIAQLEKMLFLACSNKNWEN